MTPADIVQSQRKLGQQSCVSVKLGMSYKTKGMLKEQIDAKMIFYDKKKNYIEVQIDEPF